MTTKLTEADFMRSAKHLTAHAVAVVAGGFTSGITWRGSSKGAIAKGLSERHGGITEELLFALRSTQSITQVGHRGSNELRRGDFGVTEADREKLLEVVVDCEKRLKVASRVTPMWSTDARLKNAQAALTWLDSRSTDPRVAALGRLRMHLKNHPALLADLAVVSALAAQKES